METRNSLRASLLSLPTELLVYTISFLPDVRERVKLRYVSRRLRSISEAPSLWREFAWPGYDRSQERCVCNVLRACGEHIEILRFFGHLAPRVAPSKLIMSLKYCGNVKHLSLPAEIKLSIERLRETLQHMKCLKTLDVHMSTTEPETSCNNTHLLALTANQQEATLHFSLEKFSFLEWHVIKDWIVQGLHSKNLNIVMPMKYAHSKVSNDYVHILLSNWTHNNSDIPADRTTCIRVFYGSKVPLSLYEIPPSIQLHYGQSATLPFVKASTFGILGLTTDSLLLTDTTTGGKTVHKAEYISYFREPRVANIPVNRNITDLNFVTDFDFTSTPFSQTIYSGHLEQLAVACPNLQRLNLQNNHDCLKCLKGLQTVANYCHDLQGLNLMFISVRKIECQMKLWGILNDIKLTYLAVELCVFKPLTENKQYKEQLIDLLKKCLHLQALEALCGQCDDCMSITDHDLVSLSHFPSLQHCILTHPPVIECVISNCEKLKYFMCFSDDKLLLTSMCCHNLQQLYIGSEKSDVEDTFMDAVSAHGELVHVILSVNSVTTEGITTLIKNSPKLLTFYIVTFQPLYDDKDVRLNLKTFKAKLKAKFGDRKLFTSGWYVLVQGYELYSADQLLFENTELLPVWT